MENYIKFISHLLAKIKETQNYSGLDSLLLNHHESKDYWTIDFEFSSRNSKYIDCVVFYINPKDSFDSEEIFKDFDEILDKARPFLK